MKTATTQSPFINLLKKGILPLVAGLLPLVIGLRVHSQGFNLMDDGLWLLGGRLLADGGQLYRDLFSIYGPARYVLLLPFFGIWGQSVFALAVLKAVIDGIAGGFGFWLTRRLGAGRWAWLVPVGVIALGPVYPRYVAAAIFAALVSGLLPGAIARRRGLILGLAWGVLALFGLDMAAFGLMILLGGWLLGRGKLPAWSWLELAGGGVLVLGPVLLVPVLGGYADTFWWDTVVYPTTRFGGEMGRSWWDAFRSSHYLNTIFAGLNTGEDLAPVWPGHSTWRTLAWRGWFGLAWVLPVIAGWLAWRKRLATLAPLVALGAASWSILLGRGDVDHLRLVSWVLLLLAPPLLARLGERRVFTALAVMGCCVLLVPRVAERAWLATHLDRESLVYWERPTGNISLGQNQAQQWDDVLSSANWDGQSAAVAWPSQPGLVFLLGAPLGTPQMTILAGEVRNPAQITEQWQTQPPQVIILGRVAGMVSGVRKMSLLAPQLYSYLRRNFRQGARVMTDETPFRLLHPEPGGPAAIATLPKTQRLPGDSQTVRNWATAELGPGVSVGQTVQIKDFDLSGVTLMLGAREALPQVVDLVLRVVGRKNGATNQMLAQVPLRVNLRQQTEEVVIEFPAIAGTQNQTVILDIRGNLQGGSPFTLFWQNYGEHPDEAADLYPAGQAYWNQTPVAGDLFFELF